MERFAEYLRISRQPMTGLLFVFPFLLLHEAGIRIMSHPVAHSGGGVWLRGILTEGLGLPELAIPLLPIVTLVVWQYLENRPGNTPPMRVFPEYGTSSEKRSSGSGHEAVSENETSSGHVKKSEGTGNSGRNDGSGMEDTERTSPEKTSGTPITFRQRFQVLPDMLPESVALAIVLRLLLEVEAWGVEWLTGNGPALRLTDPVTLREGVAILVSHCGAGLYEEYLFRLILTGGLAMMIRSYLPERSSWLIAIVVSSVFFVAAHHLGRGGEPILWREPAFQLSVLFRFSASMILGVIYWKRGFGITVGSHVFYNLFIRIVP
ncbi:MAG: CPBP family intramembrane metalloprotease [Planctomycetia bacterium]|nr:CPBP family intramembrane metalloprotease [Planctomycetia bacterium]